MAVKRQKKIFIQQELERRILKGLGHEWEIALWTLSPAHRTLMRMPTFSLQNMKRRWGYWSSDKNIIVLNRFFVLNYPWDDVREVLHHEMAHQMSEQVLGAQNEPPHGLSFQKACHLLRANPKASGTYQPLHERILSTTTDPGDKMMIRARKLLALAESPNHHEAEAAMTKAHELIAKHHLEVLSQDSQRDFMSVFLGKPALRHRREVYHLSRLIQDYYFVQGIWIPAYVMEKGKMGRVLEISGRVHHIQMAHYVYDFIINFIDRQWAEYRMEKQLNRSRKTDFAVGIIEGFRSRLENKKNALKSTVEAGALIEREDPLLAAHMRYKYPNTSTFRRNVAWEDGKIRKDGLQLGQELVISKGIAEKCPQQGLLIEGRSVD
jgi:hypothetical protein